MDRSGNAITVNCRPVPNQVPSIKKIEPQGAKDTEYPKNRSVPLILRFSALRFF